MILETIRETVPQIVSLYSNLDLKRPLSTTLAKNNIRPLLLLLSTTIAAAATSRLLLKPKSTSVTENSITNISMSNLVSKIYDAMIVHMTEKWYMCVLNQLDDNCTILDVGIGTAGALLRCQEIIKTKNIKVIGIDYNPYYISAAQSSIDEHGMADYITVHCIDLYDGDALKTVIQNQTKGESEGDGFGLVDVVYFSGSFSLLPDPKGGLLSVMPLLRKKTDTTTTTTNASATNTTGRVYITQTYQKHVLPLLSNVKPLIKYLTTIDFGQLVKVDEIYELLNDEELVQNKLLLKEHNVIEGSLDNYWQAAYLSVLEVQTEVKVEEDNGQTDTAKNDNVANNWDEC